MTTEIEFVFESQGDILPIEVKAGLNLKSIKEIKVRQDWPLFLIQECLRQRKAIPK